MHKRAKTTKSRLNQDDNDKRDEEDAENMELKRKMRENGTDKLRGSRIIIIWRKEKRTNDNGESKEKQDE
eukprot:3390712-Heterocapsa_arctica.AAC.1